MEPTPERTVNNIIASKCDHPKIINVRLEEVRWVPERPNTGCHDVTLDVAHFSYQCPCMDFKRVILGCNECILLIASKHNNAVVYKHWLATLALRSMFMEGIVAYTCQFLDRWTGPWLILN
jgi:hypothetical protein